MSDKGNRGSILDWIFYTLAWGGVVLSFGTWFVGRDPEYLLCASGWAVLSCFIRIRMGLSSGLARIERAIREGEKRA